VKETEVLASCLDDFNSAQLEAILSALSMVLTPSTKPQLAMVQGPPGTGKSHVVTGIMQLLVKLKALDDGAILVCAPSNTALDQLVKRIKKEDWALPLSMVRVGRLDMMDEEVREFCPDGEMSEVKAKLQQAHIIFATLNTAGSSLMESLVKKQFSCVIIDEACQSTEPDFLIPIVKFAMTKVIAVGDHLQLPPTVLSQTARSLHLHHSFVQRFHKSLQSRGLKNQMFLLDTQYRMRPEICSFPSGMLQDLADDLPIHLYTLRIVPLLDNHPQLII
jgi:superfamily I DNA and/or RNA helicase